MLVSFRLCVLIVQFPSQLNPYHTHAHRTYIQIITYPRYHKLHWMFACLLLCNAYPFHLTFDYIGFTSPKYAQISNIESTHTNTHSKYVSIGGYCEQVVCMWFSQSYNTTQHNTNAMNVKCGKENSKTCTVL